MTKPLDTDAIRARLETIENESLTPESNFKFTVNAPLDIEALLDEVERLRKMLRIATCPNCDGSGTYYECGEAAQCQWCDERAALANTQETDDG